MSLFCRHNPFTTRHEAIAFSLLQIQLLRCEIIHEWTFPLYPKIVTDHSFTESPKIASVVLTLSCILPVCESKTKTGELIKRKRKGHYFMN